MACLTSKEGAPIMILDGKFSFQGVGDDRLLSLSMEGNLV